jgi:hypothetical protein
MTDSETEINAETNFVWPDSPPQDWWSAQGAALGLDDGQIKFAAALHQLGGADSKKNSQAAKLAGMPWDRVQAFRQARSVAVRKPLTEANSIKRGRREPVTETEVDEAIDRLIRAPDALTVARGVELREKRKAARRTQFDAGDDEPWLLDARIAAFHLSRPHGAVTFMLWFEGAHLRMGHPANYPLLHDVHHLAMREEPFGKMIWDWACAPLSDVMREALNEKLADPNYQVAERIMIWTEVGKKPPGPIPSQPITGDETHVA